MSMNIEIKNTKESEEKKIYLLTIYSFDKMPVSFRKELNSVFIVGVAPPDGVQEVGNIVFSSESLSSAYITNTSFQGEKSVLTLVDPLKENGILKSVQLFTKDEAEIAASVSHVLLTAQQEFTKMMNDQTGRKDIYVFEPKIIEHGGFAERITNVILNTIIEKTFCLPTI